MIRYQLLLKYKGKYICSIENKEYDFIQVPNYFYAEDIASIWENSSIFISLLMSGNITDKYESINQHSYYDWEEIFSLCDFDYMHALDENICLYDIDEFAKMHADISLKPMEIALEKLSNKLVSIILPELESIQKDWLQYTRKIDELDISEKPYGYYYFSRVSPDLLEHLRRIHNTVTDHTALLLYSGGKDSTLSAIRLRKVGYYVDFLHFNNGFMRDADKPYLTFKRTFSKLKGYHFPYDLSNVDIKGYFFDYFNPWKQKYGDIVEGGTIHSEIRCLSCRLAMYTKAFEIAQEGNYKVIAEGARISQKFMLEQQPMIDRLQNLGKELGIKILFPVLYLESDLEEQNELLKSGFSSKGWESKCLLGRTAMEKTPEDEQVILDYYDTVVKPKVLKYLK